MSARWGDAERRAEIPTPQRWLDDAGQAVRAFLHQTGPRFAPQAEGWKYVPDAYRCLGELTYLVAMLPQVGDHLGGAIRAALAAGEVGIDRGAPDEGHPELAVARALAALADAERAAKALHEAYAAAQVAINRAHYSDRNSGGNR